MMLSARFPLAGLYRLEVSGWDQNHMTLLRGCGRNVAL